MLVSLQHDAVRPACHGYKMGSCYPDKCSSKPGANKRYEFAAGASESLDKHYGESPWVNTEAAAWGIGGTLVGRHDKYPDQRRQECGRRPLY